MGDCLIVYCSVGYIWAYLIVGASVFGLVVLSRSKSVNRLQRRAVDNYGRAVGAVHSTRRRFTSTRGRCIDVFTFRSSDHVSSHCLIGGRPIDGIGRVARGSCYPGNYAPLCSTIKSAIISLHDIAGRHRLTVNSIAIVASNCRGSSARCSLRRVITLVSTLGRRN